MGGNRELKPVPFVAPSATYYLSTQVCSAAIRASRVMKSVCKARRPKCRLRSCGVPSIGGLVIDESLRLGTWEVHDQTAFYTSKPENVRKSGSSGRG